MNCSPDDNVHPGPTPTDEPTVGEEVLAAYVLGELDRENELRVESLLATNALAWEAMTRLWTTLGILKTDDGADPPRELVSRAKAMVRAEAGADAGWLAGAMERARRVVAALVFDSDRTPALSGFRGGAVDRQLVFNTDRAEIDVQLKRGGGPVGEATCEVRGQIDVKNGEPGVIRVALVARDGSSVVETEVDAAGGFKLNAPSTSFEMMLLLGDDLVTIPGLDG